METKVAIKHYGVLKIDGKVKNYNHLFIQNSLYAFHTRVPLYARLPTCDMCASSMSTRQPCIEQTIHLRWLP